MIILQKNSLIITDESNDLIKKAKIIEINNFNDSKKTFPEKKLHLFSLNYILRFNEIISKNSSNYDKVDSRKIEILFFEMVSWWTEFIKQNNIQIIIFNNFFVCPFAYTLIISGKFSRLKLKIKISKKKSINRVIKKYKQYEIKNDEILLNQNSIIKAKFFLYNLIINFNLNKYKKNYEKKLKYHFHFTYYDYLHNLIYLDDFINIYQYTINTLNKFKKRKIKIVFDKNIFLYSNNLNPLIGLNDISDLKKKFNNHIFEIND